MMKYVIIMFSICTIAITPVQASLNPADPYQGTIFDPKHNVPSTSTYSQYSKKASNTAPKR